MSKLGLQLRVHYTFYYYAWRWLDERVIRNWHKTHHEQAVTFISALIVFNLVEAWYLVGLGAGMKGAWVGLLLMMLFTNYRLLRSSKDKSFKWDRFLDVRKWYIVAAILHFTITVSVFVTMVVVHL